MFSIPGILCLIIFIYVRPQEFIPILRSLPTLYMFLAMGIFGYLVDLKIRRTRPLATPMLGWAIAFILWSLISTAVRVPRHLPLTLFTLSIPLALYLLIGHSVQTFRAFQTVAITILAIVVFLTVWGTYQGLQPTGCFVVSAGHTLTYDGRPCVNRPECDIDGEPGAEYDCEHVGLFGTSSIEGRVRYLGTLGDPNELALVVAIGLPFAFALFERKRSTMRALLAIAIFALCGAVEVFSQSRGGQLVFLTVLAVYFVKQQGWKGLVIGLVVAAPILLLGGRSGDDAAESSEERIALLGEALSLFRQFPTFGVGQGQFTEYSDLTAHNAYLLALSELGLMGLVLWSSIVYMGVRIPLNALLRLGRGGPSSADGGAADVARAWGTALLASWIAFLVGVFFLSFTYHQILWIYLGLLGAYYSAMKTHDEGYEVVFGVRELFSIVAADIALITVILAYVRLRGGKT